VTEALVPKLEIPVIGIGAGPATDGQVLVLHDLLGVYDGHQPKFVKRFANLREQSLKGVRTYADEVRARRFPDDQQHTYSIPQEELEEFARYLEQEALVGTDTPWDW
jgi:3-methyl-2-oxobutanoate hydroxymethyltransferase